MTAPDRAVLASGPAAPAPAAPGPDRPAEDPVPGSPRLPRIDAFDGLRALAVGAVLVYHLDLGWLPGGFLGVSLFFTLSGFLITSLALVESDRDGHLSLRSFWARRVRRILPVALAGLVFAILFAAFAGDPGQLRRLPGDVVAALADVANWRFILSGDRYLAGYQAPSPVLQYWSLAIEEQFYLLFPLVAAALVARRATARTWLVVFGAVLAASMALTLVLFNGDDTSRIYFGTGTRIAEILFGVLLAVVVRGWWARPAPTAVVRPTGGLAVARTAVPFLAVAGTVMLWWRVSLTDEWLYRGGFWVVALLSCVLVAGARAGGPFARMLGLRPLVALGAISYGVYVYHWPIFLWLTPERAGFGGAGLAVVRLALTGAVAVASYRYLERPIRSHRVRWSARTATVFVLVIASILLGAVVLGSRADDRAVHQAEAASSGAPLVTQPPITAASDVAGPQGTTMRPPVAPPRRVLFLGDSQLHQAFPVIAHAFADAGADSRAIGGPGQTLLAHQGAWAGELDRALAEYDPDVVVIESCCGHGDEKDPYRENGVPLAPDSPELWQAWEREAGELVAKAQQQGRLVLWVLAPPAKTNGYYGPIEGRIGTANDIALRLAADHPGLGFVDWRVIAGPGGSYTDTLADAAGEQVTVRAKDGLHFTPAGMAVLADLTRSSVEHEWQAAGGRSRPAG